MSASRDVALQEVAQIERHVLDPSAIEDGTFYVGLENIEPGGRFVGVRPVAAGELLSSKFSFTSRHLLYGKLRPYLAKIARPDFEGICSTDILPVLPGPDLDRDYLAWLLLSPQMVAHASSRATGANLPRLSPNALAELKIPLPPLPEQRRIAEILDKADALRAKRRAALARLDTLTQSIFLDMFGDPATNPKGWPTALLSELGEISTGKTPPTGLEGMFGGDIPFATPGDLDVGLEYTQRTVTNAGAEYTTIVRPGSALVGCIGNIGKMAKAPVRCAFNQQINAVEWNRSIDDDYGIAALAFTTPQMLVLSSSTTVPILNKSSFSKVRIPVPPLERQREFAAIIGKLGDIRQPSRASLSDLDVLFASLQSRAFRGEP